MELWFRKDTMKRILVMLVVLALTLISKVSFAQEWWQTWEVYPKVPKITAREVKNLMMNNEKLVLVYAGYEVDKIVCGSFYIPYTAVPPTTDGSGIVFRVPTDYWVMCY